MRKKYIIPKELQKYYQDPAKRNAYIKMKQLNVSSDYVTDALEFFTEMEQKVLNGEKDVYKGGWFTKYKLWYLKKYGKRWIADEC